MHFVFVLGVGESAGYLDGCVIRAVSEILFVETKSIEIATREKHEAQGVNDCRFPRVVLPNYYAESVWEVDSESFDLPKVLNLKLSQSHGRWLYELC